MDALSHLLDLTTDIYLTTATRSCISRQTVTPLLCYSSVGKRFTETEAEGGLISGTDDVRSSLGNKNTTTPKLGTDTPAISGCIKG